jgi:hypothetical protein
MSESSERSRLNADDGWHSRLTDLHILAECGDATASAAAEEWIASDPAARHMWQQVDADCARLRIGTSQDGQPAVTG